MTSPLRGDFTAYLQAVPLLPLMSTQSYLTFPPDTPEAQVAR